MCLVVVEVDGVLRQKLIAISEEFFNCPAVNFIEKVAKIAVRVAVTLSGFLEPA